MVVRQGTPNSLVSRSGHFSTTAPEEWDGLSDLHRRGTSTKQCHILSPGTPCVTDPHPSPSLRAWCRVMLPTSNSPVLRDQTFHLLSGSGRQEWEFEGRKIGLGFLTIPKGIAGAVYWDGGTGRSHFAGHLHSCPRWI